jgi:hypothetical protein
MSYCVTKKLQCIDEQIAELKKKQQVATVPYTAVVPAMNVQFPGASLDMAFAQPPKIIENYPPKITEIVEVVEAVPPSVAPAITI